jgi:hypothetical protein
LVPVVIDLAKDHVELVTAIKSTLCDDNPAAVVLDTLNRSLVGSESSDEDMAAYVKAADSIRAAFDCAVLVVHHCGVNDSRPRGHTSLTGAADAQLAVKRDASGTIIVTVEWMKDGAGEGDVIASTLELVEVGHDQDGEPITSCVVAASTAAAATSKRAGKLTKSAEVALTALDQALDEAGEVPPASNHIPAGTKAVSLMLWRKYAYARGISGSEQERARQLAFQRAAESLFATQVVGTWQEHCWRTSR